jgi:hypothetical protein
MFLNKHKLLAHFPSVRYLSLEDHPSSKDVREQQGASGQDFSRAAKCPKRSGALALRKNAPEKQDLGNENPAAQQQPAPRIYGAGIPS